LVYDTSSENRLRFLGYCLNECLHVVPEYYAAYFVIPQKILKQFKTQTGDTEGLVNYALSVTGVNLAVTLIEYPDEIRISLRSVGEISVAKIANQHFNGGGHKNAAGGRVQISLADAEERLLGVIRQMGASAFNHKD
jgi:phosphoesterase RecJ-like protein